MARWEPWAIIDGAYSDTSRPWSSQDTVNWLPTPAEQSGTRSPSMLRTPPGLELYVDLGTNAPLRGSHDVEGLLLVVSGSTLFKVVDGVATSIGTIPGVGRVSMDHVPRGTGFQVGIANGSSGYVYNTADNTLVQITDEGFPGAVIFQFVDNYLAFLEPFGRFWGHSELNDALNYNTLDRYTAESAPDQIRSLIQSHREIFAPGTRSGEFFRNTGSATGTFQRSDGTEMERGCATPFAIARWDNTVVWLGEDNSVYRLEGHQPVRISTGPIEQAIAAAGSDNAFMFTWEDRGHEVVYLTLPNGQTWGFDAWTQRWHRRESYGLNRWRLSTLTKTRGDWIGGDYQNGKLYRLVWQEGAVHENGQTLESRRRFPVAHDNGNPLIINGVKLMFDTGGVGPVELHLSGDIPDGLIGEAINGSYSINGGVPPYGSIAVVSGSLPSGITLDPDGSWSGTYTTRGTFSWTVGVTDALGSTATLVDTAQVCEQIVGSSVTNTATLAGDDRVSTLYYNADEVGYAEGAYGISVAGSVGFGSLNSTLTPFNTGTYTVQAGSPGDARLFSLGQGLDGVDHWAFSGDDGFGYAELWKNGAFQCRLKRTGADADTWFGVANGAGEDGAYAYLTWFDEGYAYVGIRIRGGTNFRKIYKWPLTTSGSFVLAEAISPDITAGVASNGYYWDCIDRDGRLWALDKNTGNLMELSKTDLSIISTTATGLSMTDVKCFVVDADKLMVYYGGVTQQLRVYRRATFALITSVPITGTTYQFNNKVICSSDSIILQSGRNLKRIPYGLVCTP